MRHLKAFGMALLGVLALGAAAAPLASANQFHSTSTNTTWTVSSNAQQVFQYEAGGEQIACTTITGEIDTTSQTVSELTFTPTYSNCEAVALGLQTHVVMNGCDYLFTINASSNTGPMHIRCPEAKKISMTVTFVGSSLCTLEIGAQTPSGVDDYVNASTSQVQMSPTQTGIAASSSSGFCGKATSTTGTFSGWVTWKGEVTGQQTAANVQVG